MFCVLPRTRTRLLQRAWPVAAVVLLTLVCAPAAHARPRAVLVYGPGVPGAEAEKRAREQAASMLRRSKVEAVHVGEVPFFGPAPAWVVGDVAVDACAGELRETAAIRALVERGREQTDLLEDEAAAASFRSAWLALRCADDFTPGELLYEIHFASGVLAFVAGDVDAARAHFAQAVATDPRRPFDQGYAPEIERLYDQSRRAHTEAAGVPLIVRDPERTLTAVWLDGRSVTGSDRVKMTPGDHLLQLRTRLGTFTSLQLRVADDGAAVLLTRSAMVEALLDPTHRAARKTAVAALAQLVERREADAAVVVRLGDDPLVYRHERGANGLVRQRDAATSAAATGPSAPTAPRGEHPRRVALSLAGGALVYPVAGVPPADAGYGAALLSVEIPLVGPLALDLGAGLALRGAGLHDGARWTYLLPRTHAGVRVHLLRGPVRPYVGGSFQLLLHQARDRWGRSLAAVPIPGGAAVAGASFEPAGPLRLHVQLELGYAGGFTALVTGGAGVRF